MAKKKGNDELKDDLVIEDELPEEEESESLETDDSSYNLTTDLNEIIDDGTIVDNQDAQLLEEGINQLKGKNGEEKEEEDPDAPFIADEDLDATDMDDIFRDVDPNEDYYDYDDDYTSDDNY